MAMTGKQGGFSLLELAIVIAILSIIASVAYPTYVAHVQRTNRAAAKAVIEQAAQYMERQFTMNNAYPNSAALAAAGYDVVPIGATGAAVKYNVSLGAGSGTGAFLIQAVPVTASIDPSCQTMNLDNIGNRTSSYGNSLECWQK